MLRLITAIAAIASLASCVSVNAQVDATDASLTAINRARVRTCPAERIATNAQTGGETQSVGVTIEDLAIAPLSSDPTRAVRLRRITVAPGGTIAWHTHESVQGVAIMVAGAATETRNSCRDQIIYRAGDIAMEDVGTAHSWRNHTDEPTVILVSHVVPRPQ